MPPETLRQMLELDALTYRAVGADSRSRVAARFAPDVQPLPPVDGYEGVLTWALCTVGARDAAAFAPLVRGAVAQLESLEHTVPHGLQPHLSLLCVLNLLEVMGNNVPRHAWDMARTWLPEVQTHIDNNGPDAWHWERGLAAIALGDSDTARRIAALPASGPTGVDLAADPGLSVQAWLAWLIAAQEARPPLRTLIPRWRQLLDFLPLFISLEHLNQGDVAWVGRILHHQIAGQPLQDVANWVRDELHHVAHFTLVATP